MDINTRIDFDDPNPLSRYIGRVNWYSRQKSYGFICIEYMGREIELFFHKTALPPQSCFVTKLGELVDIRQIPQNDQLVEFSFNINLNNGKRTIQAINVVPISQLTEPEIAEMNELLQEKLVGQQRASTTTNNDDTQTTTKE